jgi:hypothetical protein
VAIVTDTALAQSLLAGLGLASEPVSFAPAARRPKPTSPGTTPRRSGAPAPTGHRLLTPT